MSERELPYSRQVYLTKTDYYWITAAEWHSQCNHCFEVGVRDNTDPEKFWLISGDWNERSVVKVADAVRLMLDAGYTPTEIAQEVFQ